MSRWVVNQWDRSLAIALVIAGAVMLIVGWFGVTSQKLPAGQIPYVVSGAIGALFVLGVAATLWVSADLSDEWRKLDELARLLGDEEGRELSEAEPSEAEPSDEGARLDAAPADAGRDRTGRRRRALVAE